MRKHATQGMTSGALVGAVVSGCGKHIENWERQLNLVDVSDIFYFFFCSGWGKGEAEASGGGGGVDFY